MGRAQKESREVARRGRDEYVPVRGRCILLTADLPRSFPPRGASSQASTRAALVARLGGVAPSAPEARLDTDCRCPNLDGVCRSGPQASSSSTEAGRRPSDTIAAMRRESGATGRVAAAAGADPAEAWRAAACFEDRAMVTAGAGSGKTRTMVARAGYAARRLRTPPKAIAFITFTNKATEEIRQRTRERLPGLQVGTIHQLARRVLKLVDGRTVQLSPMAEDEGLRLRRIAGWIREEIVRDPGLAADVELHRNARSAAVKDGEPVERHRIPPDGREVKSHGEVVIGTLLHTASVPFIYGWRYGEADACGRTRPIG